MVTLTFGDVYKLWHEGVVVGPSGVTTPPLSTFVTESDAAVRWLRDTSTQGMTNRSTVTRYKTIVNYMTLEANKLVSADTTLASALETVAAAMTEKWGANKLKAATAINKLNAARAQ